MLARENHPQGCDNGNFADHNQLKLVRRWVEEFMFHTPADCIWTYSRAAIAAQLVSGTFSEKSRNVTTSNRVACDISA